MTVAVIGAALIVIGFVVVFGLPTANPYLAYFRYLIRHKLIACVTCWSLGIPWRGITHDLSKFFPSEFGAYARFHFGGQVRAGEPRAADFERAWHWHYARNPHHWEHWVVPRNGRSGVVAKMLRTFAISGQPIGVEEMSDTDMREMLADWLAQPTTKREPGDPFENARAFYLTNRDRIILTVRAREFVEHELAIPQVRETGWRDPQAVLNSQLIGPVALRKNEPVVAPGGRRGVFLGYQRGKALVRLDRTDALLHVHEKDLQRV